MSLSVRLHRLGRRSDPTSLEVSCGVMDVMRGTKIVHRVVVDAGLSPRAQPDGRPWSGPDLSLFSDGRKIDAVCITHVHGDHVGFLPALVPFLSSQARIFMSWTSKQMLWDVLKDGIDISRRRDIKGPYDMQQLLDVTRRVEPLYHPGQFRIRPGLEAFAWPAGHIPGACSFTFRVGSCNVHYAGDRCEHDQPGILGAKPLPADWRKNSIIACWDCTYGAESASDGRDWQSEMDRGAAIARDTIARGKPVLFFTFGVHRGGAVAHELQRRGITGLVPTYLDGACRKHTRTVTNRRNHWCDNDVDIRISDVREIENVNERAAVAQRGTPYVVIAPPGMGGPGGVMSYWREFVLPDPGAAVLFTGFVADDTDGKEMLDAVAVRPDGGTAYVTFTVESENGDVRDVEIPIRCQMAQIRLGGHQSRRETIDGILDLDPIAAVLNHGSEASLASLAAELEGDVHQLYRADLEPSIEIDV